MPPFSVGINYGRLLGKSGSAGVDSEEGDGMGMERVGRGWQRRLRIILMRCQTMDGKAMQAPIPNRRTDLLGEEFSFHRKNDKIDYLLSFLHKILILIEKQLQDSIF